MLDQEGVRVRTPSSVGYPSMSSLPCQSFRVRHVSPPCRNTICDSSLEVKYTPSSFKVTQRAYQ
eukprot:scaffold49748_cov54-Attheya_sp.AAC.1